MDLSEIRQEIDSIDGQMKEMFLRRMDCAGKVAEIKKKAGNEVYVREREQEILNFRATGVQEKYIPACRAFFGHMMEISRLYQYAKMTDKLEDFQKLPQKEGEVVIDFLCCRKTGQVLTFLNGASLAGLKAEIILTEERTEGIHNRIRLCGDFSSEIAKAAVLMIFKESESAVFL